MMDNRPWPEVEVPKGWKKNPKVAARVTWISVLTLVIAGALIILTAGRSDFLPMVFFLALVLVPFVGPAAARWGQGANYKENREMHTVAQEDVKLQGTEAGWQVIRYRGPYQKLYFPQELDGRPIASLAEGLFRDNHVLAYVHLPEGIGEIPASLFERCDNLPAVMLPAGVRSIGARAFHGCAELKDVYIPASVTEIAPDAFEGCGDLILHVREGSAAETYAKEQEILYSCR